MEQRRRRQQPGGFLQQTRRLHVGYRALTTRARERGRSTVAGRTGHQEVGEDGRIPADQARSADLLPSEPGADEEGGISGRCFMIFISLSKSRRKEGVCQTNFQRWIPQKEKKQAIHT